MGEFRPGQVSIPRALAIVCFALAAIIDGAQVASGVFTWQLFMLTGLFFLAWS